MVTVSVKCKGLPQEIVNKTIELVRRLLVLAGMADGSNWQLIHLGPAKGTPHTKGVHLRGHKNGSVILSVQPGDNGTNNGYALATKSGQAENLFRKLKAVETLANNPPRSERKQDPLDWSSIAETAEAAVGKEPPQTLNVAPVVEPRKSLRGFTKDKNNVCLVLMELYGKFGRAIPADAYFRAICDIFDFYFTGVANRQVRGITKAISRHFKKDMVGGKLKAYLFKEKTLKLLKKEGCIKELPAPVCSETAAPEVTVIASPPAPNTGIDIAAMRKDAEARLRKIDELERCIKEKEVAEEKIKKLRGELEEVS